MIIMAAISTYLANKLLDATLKNTSYSSPAKVYLALYTSNPGADNSGSEVSGSNYSRTEIAFGSASNGATTNSANTVTAIASGSWGAVTHFGIFDAATSGNLLFFGALTTSRTIGSGGAGYVALGELDIAIT
jgi:hypothetical protein